MLSRLLELLSGPLVGEPVRARVARHRAVAIADVADGARACVTGTVRVTGPQTAPISGRPCAGWFVTIEETGVADARVAGVTDGGGELRLVDAAGTTARVVLGGARVYLPATEARRYLGGMAAAHQWASGDRILFERAKVTLNYPETSGVRFTEHAIFDGMTLSLLGHVHREPDRSVLDGDRAGYRGDMPTQPVFSDSRRSPLLIAVGRR